MVKRRGRLVDIRHKHVVAHASLGQVDDLLNTLPPSVPIGGLAAGMFVMTPSFVELVGALVTTEVDES